MPGSDIGLSSTDHPRQLPTSPSTINTLLLLLSLCFSSTSLAGLPHEEHWQQIQQSMQQAEQHANYWQWGWTGAYTASLAFNLYQSSEASQPEDRYDARVHTITNTLGLVELIFYPLPHSAVAREISSLKRQADNGSVSPSQALAEAESLFLNTAQDEIDRRSWRSRIGGIFTASIAGLAIGIGDHRPKDGAITFASSLFFKELQIRTLPTTASQGWNQYRPIELALGDQRLDIFYAVQLMPGALDLNIRF